jgi:hypothetical protein
MVMSTELKSSAPGVMLTRFAGGEDRGVCIQVTVRDKDSLRPDGLSFIHLTREQAGALGRDLMAFEIDNRRAC